MKTYLVSLYFATAAIGIAFAGPNNGPNNVQNGQNQNHPQNVQQFQAPKLNIVQPKLNVVNPVVQPKVIPNLVPNKIVAAPKKIDPQFKLTKFNNANKVANYNLVFG